MTPYRNGSVALSAANYKILGWLAKARNVAKDKNALDNQHTRDSVADEIVAQYVARSCPQLLAIYQRREELDKEAIEAINQIMQEQCAEEIPVLNT